MKNRQRGTSALGRVAMTVNGSATPNSERYKKRLIIVSAFLLAFFIVCIAMFVLSYTRLQRSIQQERIAYVEEISNQIVTSHKQLKLGYTQSIIAYSRLCKNFTFTSLEDFRNRMYSYGERELLLVTEGGDLINLQGNKIVLLDNNLRNSLKLTDEVTQSFTFIGVDTDYWVFATALNPINVTENTPLIIDGVTYTHILLAIPSEDFSESLAISLLDARGSTYIIKSDGFVQLKPSVTEHANIVFGGSNVFSSMMRYARPNEKKAVEELAQRVGAEDNGHVVISLNREDWLVEFAKTDDFSAIVVVVPLTVTAQSTYQGLTFVIISAVLAVLTIGAFAVVGIRYYFAKDKERARAMAAVSAKSDFLSRMSHDIRTPLNAIIGMETLAKESINDPPLAINYLDKSILSSNYLLGIINDILDMSRIESGKMTINEVPFDLTELLANLTGMIASQAIEKNISYSTKVVDKPTVEYIGDKVRINQILVNLLSNAIKFTNVGGSVTLTVSKQHFDEQKDTLSFEVTDTGIGIADEFIPNLFRAFEQERSSLSEQRTGSGLGLSIVNSLVGLMGGEIYVKSKKGVGTTFVVILSLERGKEIESIVKHEVDETVTFKNRRVLLAEDNILNQQVAIAILVKKFGLMVELATNGEEAVEKFYRSPLRYYDLILMDIKMPVLDGLEAAKQIRSFSRSDSKTVPIVALSANAFEEDVQLSLQAGMNTHIAKPIRIKELSGVLQKYISNGDTDEEF